MGGRSLPCVPAAAPSARLDHIVSLYTIWAARTLETTEKQGFSPGGIALAFHPGITGSMAAFLKLAIEQGG